MLLQISTKDSLNSLSVSGGQPDNSTLIIIIGLLIVGIIIYLIIQHNKDKKASTETKSETATKIADSVIIKNDIKTIINLDQEKIKSETKQKAEIKKSENKSETPITTEQPKKTVEIKVPQTIIIKPEIEEQSKEKYIGYNPINIFAQTEPLYFPYVLMPNHNSVIKFPRKGRSGRKGYKEEDFKNHIDKYFKSCFQILDDRFILIKNRTKPFEPDFTLIDEKEGINIFLDIEIDEPYEGLNDVVNRKPTHFQYSDTDRNNAFKNRGWIIIRFAEIQVHQQPDSCCLFISDVIKSINSRHKISENLTNTKKIQPIRQWTKEEAEIWSINKYREKYLGILSFGLTADGMTLTDINETELGDKIEEKVKDDVAFITPKVSKTTNPKLEQINSSIKLNKFLSFKYNDSKTIVKPIKATETTLTDRKSVV